MGELLRRLRFLFRRGRFDRDLEEEMRLHLELQAEANREAGMDAEEARYAARRRFGNPTLLRETSAETWGWRWIERLMQDLAYALRILRKDPGFTTVGIVSLALGIGVNVAIFTFINALVLRPIPVPEPSRLVSVYHQVNAGLSPSSYQDYAYYRDHSTIFSGMLAYLRLPMILLTGSDSEKVSGELVSPDYFSTLGIQPALGRHFTPQGDGEGREPVAVISFDAWQRRFGGDGSIVGKVIVIGQQPLTVIGVAPRGFRGVVLDWGEPPEVWVPAGLYRQAIPPFADLDVLHNWGMHTFLVVGRLRPGATLEQAQAELEVLSSRAAPQRARAFKGETRISPLLFPAQEARVWPGSRGSVFRFLWMLAAVSAVILVVACFNLASLSLARASSREKEMALRLSLGAGRARILRQLLTESLLLALLGGAAGLAVAHFTSLFLARFRAFSVPLWLDAGFDGRVFAFAFLVSFAAGMLFGILPARRCSRADLNSALKPAGAAGSPRMLSRDCLMVAQVALSLLLLVAAGLFVRTLRNARAAEITVDPTRVLLARLDLASKGYDGARRAEFCSRLLARVQALPAVEKAAVVMVVPLGGRRGGHDILVPGEKRPVQVDFNIVSQDYFELAGLPLLGGRLFAERDAAGAPQVAIINEQMARRFWPNEDPLGRTFQIELLSSKPIEIVGVVRDGRFRNYRTPVRPCFYLHTAQQPPREMSLELRTAGNALQLAPALRREIRNLDPAFAPDILTLEDHRDAGLGQERLSASLLSLLSGLALVLVTVGIYGLTSYQAARRTQEIGIRMALGARRRDVLAMMLRHALLLATIGLAIGGIAALLLARLLASQLYGVSERDPLTLAMAGALLLATALCAAYIPARRATKIDPMEALRHE
jgi:predicted permease